MAKREEFAPDWDTFHREWLLGNGMRMSPETAWAALAALERHMPEKLDRILQENKRGGIILANPLSLGATLKICEPLDGFHKVLKRVRDGERSAFSELKVAATFVTLGHRPILEPPLNGEILDTFLPENQIYVEVVAPEFSDAEEEHNSQADALASDLLAFLPDNLSLDVCLTTNPEPESNVRALNAIKERVTPSPSIGIHEVGPTLVFRLAEFSTTLIPFSPRPEILFRSISRSAVTREGGVSKGKRVTVSYPQSDERLKRIMNKESEQFSRSERNLLVCDLTAATSAVSMWKELIPRVFQPTQNRRFGAIALFWGGIRGCDVEFRWGVYPNKYAEKPIPEEFVTKLRGLVDYRK